MNTKILDIIVGLIILTQQLNAQLPVRIEGLIDNESSFLFSDSQSNLWISSDQYGINIYDGKYNVKKLISDSSGIKGNWIQGQIIEDYESNIWFSTYSHFIKYKPSSDRFESYKIIDDILTTFQNCHIITEDAKQKKLLATADYTVISFDPNSTSDYEVLFKTKGRRFATNQHNKTQDLNEIVACKWREGYGIEFFIKKNNRWKNKGPSIRYENPSIEASKAIHFNNNYYLATQLGLFKFNPTSLSCTSLKGPEGLLRDILPLNNNTLLLSYGDGVLYTYTTLDESFNYYKDFTQFISPIKYIFSDSNNVYYSAHRKGVYRESKYKITNSKNNFFVNTRNSNGLTYHNNKVYVTTENGIVAYDPKESKKNSVYNNRTDGLISLGQDTLVTFDAKNVYYFNNDDLVRKIEYDSSGHIVNIMEDSNYGLLVCTSRGVYTIRNRQLSKNNLPKELVNIQYVYHLKQAGNSSYLYSVDGLGLEKIDNTHIKNILDTEVRIYRIVKSNKGSFIICTEHGVYTYDFDEDKLTYLRTLGSMPVFDASVVSNDEILFQREDGIFYLDWASDRLNRITMNLPNKFNSTYYSSLTYKDSIIYTINSEGLFGTDLFNGLESMDSSTLTINSVKINNAKVQFQDAYRLKTEENNISISTSIVDQTIYNKSFVQYKKTEEEGWTDSEDGVINYSNLRPGQYYLEIRGINSNNIPSPSHLLSFTILPPYYATWWFRSLAVLGLMGIGFGANYWNTRRKLKIAQQKLEKQAALSAQRERIADDLHDELGTELSKILYLSDEATETQDISKKENLVKDITQLAATSIANMRDMLWVLEQKNDSIGSLVARLRSMGQKTLRDYPIQFQSSIVISEEEKQINISGEKRQQILLIVKEGIHNVIKHSRASNIFLHGAIHDGILRIKLSDDGKGFDPVPDTYGEKGRGLSSMQKRAKKIQALLDITSSSDGTEIHIQCPISSSNDQELTKVNLDKPS